VRSLQLASISTAGAQAVNLQLELPPEVLEAIAQRSAEIVLELRGAGEARELLTVPEAAEYLRCDRQRIYQLRSDGRLPRTSEGGRALVRRADLDGLVVDEASLSPALARRRLRSA
jgi:excisionase family DNA binding protein